MIIHRAGAAGLLLAMLAAGQTPRGPLQLSLKRAVDIAVSPEGNSKIQLAGEAIHQAEAKADQLKAELLPNLSASLSKESATRNLAGLGLGSAFSSPIPGFNFPSFVGPYGIVDARLSVSQTVLDFGKLKRYEASRSGIGVAKTEFDATQEQIAARVARAYLAVNRADADIETAQANMALSEAIEKQAESLRQAGTGTGIEITRARVQLSSDRQRLLVSRNTRRRAVLDLLRTLGLRLDTDVDLTDKLSYLPVETASLDQAIAQALRERPDYVSQQQREASVKLSVNAARMDRMPTVSAFGNYGPTGPGVDNARATREIGIQVRLSLVDFGKRARVTEGNSQYAAEKIRTRDLKDQIELDVRLAFDSLQSAQEQVQVSREGFDLAQSEVTQARRRNEAGVANALEVTDAQTRLERARDNQTAALYNYNLARIDLAQAMGNIRRAIQ